MTLSPRPMLLAVCALALATAAHAQDAAPASAAPAAPAAPAEATPPPPSSAPAPAQAPETGPAAAAAPQDGKGQIVFFRPSGMGMAIPCTVHDGDATVSKLGNGKYFIYAAPPGAHTFMVQSEAKDKLTLEVEAGETYYVKCGISMGIVMGRPNLSPSDKATFDAKAPKLKLEKPHEEAAS